MIEKKSNFLSNINLISVTIHYKTKFLRVTLFLTLVTFFTVIEESTARVSVGQPSVSLL